MNNREELARQVSPITYIRPGLPPIISVHGDADEIVPYSHAVQLHKGLDKAGVTNKLITISRGNHGGFSRQETLKSFGEIREFLRKLNLVKSNY
jgi:dipeptidyl aminopeptidase/acylaminoacyl peptidase